LALLLRLPLPRLRHPLLRADAFPVLVQLADRRVRDLPRLRPCHRHRLRPDRPGRNEIAARGRDPAVAVALLPRLPGRHREIREEARHSARHPVSRPEREGARMGARRRARVGELAQVVARGLVRRAAILQVARDQGLQDARARAPVALPRLYALRRLRRRTAQARRAAVAAGDERGRGRGDGRPASAPAGRRDVRRGRARETPRADDAQPHAAFGGPHPSVFRIAPSPGAARRSDRPAPHRNPRAAALPPGRGPGLPDARSPVAHPLGRRGAAHQPHHRARHLARQHAFRPGRALDRPASARHGPRDRRDAKAARRRQLARRRRARPADHAAGRPHPRHGAGERGGEIVFFGAPEALKAAKTITAEYLSGRRRADGTTLTLPSPASGRGSERSEGAREFLEILGAAEHNLKNIDVAVPLGRLVCITGVSGSGKSTLVQDVLYPALLKAKGRPTEAPGNFRGLKGHGLLEDVVMVDQTPIGRTTRSNPASYVGAWNAIRDIYAKEPLARERKYTAGTFSFNS